VIDKHLSPVTVKHPETPSFANDSSATSGNIKGGLKIGALEIQI
jgi:hypothetical protein